MLNKDLLNFDFSNRGYGLFTAEGSNYYIPNALHIEKLDDENKFSDDEEACIQAEKDGIKFIYDMQGVPNLVYVDTEENRKVIKESLEKYPEYYFEDYEDSFEMMMDVTRD